MGSEANEPQLTDRGAVVITGTSTGIGAACALRLADEGFSVFIGVRRQADGEALQRLTSQPLTPLQIDITDAAMITAAADTVAQAVGDRGVAGLVNNAGIVRPGPLEFQPMDDLRMQLEVNLFGQVAVTQAFLPLLRLGTGRLVNVGSIGGRLVLPLHGGYHRVEVRHGGGHRRPPARAEAVGHQGLTGRPGWQRNSHLRQDPRRDRPDGAWTAHRGIDLYDDQLAAVRALVEKTAAEAAPADHVAKAVAAALTAKRPKTRYLAGKGARAVAVAARTLPDRLKDLAVAHEAHLPSPRSST